VTIQYLRPLVFTVYSQLDDDDHEDYEKFSSNKLLYKDMH